MKALLLAGGFGTRLRPLTDHVLKPMLHLVNRPFLEHQIAWLARHGVSEVIMLAGYRADDLGSFARGLGRYGVALEVSTEETPLDTAGAARNALDRLDGTTLVLNGDVLTDLDVTAMIELHRERGAGITIALTHVEDSGSMGVVRSDDDGRVLAFVENPKDGSSRPPDWINAGIYAIEPDVLASVPPATRWSFERQLFPGSLEAGVPFWCVRSDAYWLDVGTPERFLRAHLDVLDGRVRVEPDGRMLDADVRLADGTTVRAPSLLSHAPVGPGATIGPHACIGPGAEIGEEAVVERSVVHAGARIGAGARLRNTLVGRDVAVEPGAVLDGAVLG